MPKQHEPTIDPNTATHPGSALAQKHLDTVLLRTAIGLVRGLSLAIDEWLHTIEALQPQRFEGSIDFYDLMRRFEISLIRAALLQTNSNQTRAAELLGINLTTLNTKISRFQIDLRTIRAQHEHPSIQSPSPGSNDE